MKTLVLLAAGLALAPAAAFGQWSDNFDSYPAGSINGQGPGPGASANGPWQGWDGVAAVAGTVSTVVARSAPNSQLISPANTDSVQRYMGVTSGAWVYTAWQYIPAGFTGNSYFIINSNYNDLGPYNWSVQILFSGATGLVQEDIRNGENVINFVTDQWAEIRIEFDLTADTMSQFYNGQLLLTSTYTAQFGPPGPLELQAVDLYTTTDSPVYYDDMSLVVGVTPPQCDPDFNCDGNSDQDDVGCIINVVAGNPGCECQDPDFNGDGNVDQDDVSNLINVVAGGPCP